ncbi:MAG: DUF302 domain-containing protein [Acidobacteriia bacterium]|nr:DUF302 domain-containing protein [Terriglobia bacterium]
MDIGIGKTVDLPYDVALAKVEEALKKEGFGILTRIDVKATLKEKLGVDFTPFVILGACNPPLAHRALEAAPAIGLMLPCNVVVRQTDPGHTRIEAVNATAMASLFPEADLSAVAGEVAERLARVIASV